MNLRGALITIYVTWRIPIATLLLIGAALIWFSHKEYTKTLEHEFRLLESNARIADAQIAGLARNINQLLSEVANEQGKLSPELLATYDSVLAARKEKLPEIRSLAIINAEGRVEFTGNPNLKSFDSSKRDYFIAHIIEPLEPNFYASKPFVTSFKDHSIAFSVAVRDKDKRLKGVVVSGVDPRFFNEVIKQIVPDGGGGTATLLNQQGDIINRQPDLEQYFGKSIAGGAPYREHISANTHVTRHIGVSAVDGTKRMLVFSKVQGTNLIVSAGQPLNDVLSEWRKDVLLRFSIFFVAAFIVIALTHRAIINNKKRMEAEAAQRLSEQRFTAAFNASPLAGSIARASDGRFVEANDKYEKYFGWSRAALIGKTSIELGLWKSPETRRAWVNNITTARTVIGYETDWLRSNGEPCQVSISTELLDLSGEPHILAFVQDITERKKAEAEAKKQADELQRSNADLEQFAYVASHDLREPLRTVSNYVSLLERRYADKLDDDAREFIAYARDGAKRMNNLILGLLDYSRIGRSGQPSAKLQLNEVVEQACASLQKSIDETGAIIEVLELPQVTGSPEELQRMFENLIGNAVKYRKPNSPPNIKISAEKDGGYWIVRVADNGIGIDPEYFKRIFDIFKRLHRETEYEGTGIGLASCKKIVEQHGGKIWVESQPDNGAVFIFTLPALP